MPDVYRLVCVDSDSLCLFSLGHTSGDSLVSLCLIPFLLPLTSQEVVTRKHPRVSMKPVPLLCPCDLVAEDEQFRTDSPADSGQATLSIHLE